MTRQHSAEKLQNPIADLISVPFQNNTNFNVGPSKGTQDILNIQPVIPLHINEDWNVITRTILPLVWSPSFQPDAAVPPFGLSPITFSAFFSPTQTIDGWTWGVGPIAELPTATNKTLGSNVWGIGPAVVAVRTAHPWVYGLLVNTCSRLAAPPAPAGTSYSLMTRSTRSSTTTSAKDGLSARRRSRPPVGTPAVQKWTLPVGGQFGRLIKIADKLPVNLLIGAYYNALRPQFGAGTWQLRTQVSFHLLDADT